MPNIILLGLVSLFTDTRSSLRFLLRIIDRFGKGIRTAPRDAMIAESADRSRMGKAYGLHKGLDLLGTAAGIFLAWLILSLGDNQYKTIFLYSLIPAFSRKVN